MTPIEYYQQQLSSGLIEEDPQQAELMQILQTVYEQLLKTHGKQGKLAKFVKSRTKKKAVKGVYAWGSVGVGKTFIMDCFYICYPLPKIRLHFHLFLERIHEDLTKLQGTKNPLQKIAKNLAQETSLICFDEFFVSDIGDAMILGELFTALFTEGVSLVTTSNVQPDDLYKNGLQRERFLPAIESIKKNTTVFHMVSHHDYRLTHLQQAGVYFHPLNHQTENYMDSAFQHITEGQEISEKNVILCSREVDTIKHTGDVIWFEFEKICGVPRSQNDFIEVSKQYHTVFISDIPEFAADQLNLITSFINLVDVFYDAEVRIVVSAAAEIENLYLEGKLKFEFARTQSRLIEMQSTDYFNQRTREQELHRE